MAVKAASSSVSSLLVGVDVVADPLLGLSFGHGDVFVGAHGVFSGWGVEGLFGPGMEPGPWFLV
jgi:hypothetical protein